MNLPRKDLTINIHASWYHLGAIRERARLKTTWSNKYNVNHELNYTLCSVYLCNELLHISRCTNIHYTTMARLWINNITTTWKNNYDVNYELIYKLHVCNLCTWTRQWVQHRLDCALLLCRSETPFGHCVKKLQRFHSSYNIQNKWVVFPPPFQCTLKM